MVPQIEPLLELVAELVFYMALFAFLVHLCILAFHWFSYGASQAKNISALVLYTCGGGLLIIILYMLSNALR